MTRADSDESVRKYEAYSAEETKQAEARIPLLVEQYATTLGCEFHMNPENVVPYRIQNQKVFVALFLLDIGCSGGNKMQRPVFVVMQQGAYFKMVINVDFSNPKQTSSSFPQSIERIFLKNGQLWYSGKKDTYRQDGGLRIEAPIVFRNGSWVPARLN